MPSIEILVEQPIKKISDRNDYSFAVVCTNPPSSHRDPSLWQTKFEEIGGDLYHLGNPEFKNKKNGWFFAYDLIEEDTLCKRFKFKSKYRKQVLIFLKNLLECSKSRKIYITTDWQVSPNKPYTYKNCYTVQDYVKKHARYGIRFNSWMTIIE
ncbi:MAG: hypothetical protein NC924_05665 [Candidatus Omnitrophica bacterium]|nr:hypothetical protein [Candidatus Omnitrophota bacterium]